MLRIISIMLAIVLALLGINIGLAEVAQDSEQVIKVDASRFLFRPDLITLKKGVPVIFELTSSDVILGFNVPALNIHTDIIPGKVMRFRMVPENWHHDIFM